MTRILLTNVRASYAHVFTPSPMGTNNVLKYSVCILINPNDTENLNKLKQAQEEAQALGIHKKWGGQLPVLLKKPLRNGNEKDLSKNPEYANMYFVNASSDEKPLILDRARQPITDPALFYSGCMMNALVQLYPYNTAGNKGIAVGLKGVQFVSDGEHLAGGASVNDFEDYDGGTDTSFFPQTTQPQTVQSQTTPVLPGIPAPTIPTFNPVSSPVDDLPF